MFNLLTMCHNIVLYLVLGLGLVQVIQPTPANLHSTILSDMNHNLKSARFGNCSFPPSDVLSVVIANPEEEQFFYLHKCNEKRARNHVDADVLLCMTLYDIGLKICNAEEKSAFDAITRKFPTDSTEFKKIVDNLEKDEHKNICTELPPVLQDSNFPETENWNLKSTFSLNTDACDRICYDFTDAPHVKMLCKLILYSSSLLQQTDESVQIGNGNSREPPPKATSITGTQIVKQNASFGTRKDPSTSNQIQANAIVPNKHLDEQSFNNEHEDSKTPFTSSEGHAGTAAEKQKMPDVPTASGSEPGIESTNSKLGSTNPHEEVPLKPASPQAESKTSNALITKESESAKSSSGQQALSKPVADGTSNTASDHIPDGNPGASPDLPPVSKEGSEIPDNTLPIAGGRGDASPGDASPGDVPPVSDGKPEVSGNPPPVADGGKVDVPTGNIPVVSADGSNQVIDGADANEDGMIGPDDMDDDQNYGGNPGVEAPETDASEKQSSFNMPKEDLSSNVNPYKFDDSEESHFFTYFTTMVLLSIIGYLVFHNKQKILALVLEGRSRRSNRRRPNTANYHKLDCNLEEAVSSPCNTSSAHVIY